MKDTLIGIFGFSLAIIFGYYLPLGLFKLVDIIYNWRK